VQSATWKLGAIAISILRRQYDKTYVTAGFGNQGRPVTMNFILVNRAEGDLRCREPARLLARVPGSIPQLSNNHLLLTQPRT
jgi:hypothetical protein